MKFIEIVDEIEKIPTYINPSFISTIERYDKSKKLIIIMSNGIRIETLITFEELLRLING